MPTLTILKSLLFKLLPFLLFGLLLAGIYAYHAGAVRSSYDQGHKEGIAYQQRAQQDADSLAAVQHQLDKERLERDAQSKIDQALVDAQFARDTSDRLRRQLDTIKRVAESATGPQSAGTSTSKTLSLLADLFSESVERNRALAEFADASYNAGRLCEASYDSLRREYVSSESGKGRTNP
jgi:hypothetical protein